MVVVSAIVRPKKEGVNPKIYHKEGNMFVTDKAEAHPYKDKIEADAVLNMFPELEMQIEEA